MNTAKEAIDNLLHSKNKHDIIEQTVNPAVVRERIQKTGHEEVTTAIDREVHEHHHQTHIQPVFDKQVLPEQHHHNIIPVEHREHTHGKEREVEARLAAEAAQFKSTREELATQHTKHDAGVIAGEHVHHHIHDVIQPVIEKEVIQPHVVHTVIPVHERIEHEPTIHKHTVAPVVSMEEFQRMGHQTGTKTEHIRYEGDPLEIDPNARVGFGHGLGGMTSGTTTGTTGMTTGTTGSSYDNTTTGQPKQSLLQKLNPLNKDKDHDGIPDRKERDRDHDGVLDYQEKHSGLGKHGHNKDRDGDGIPDRLEGGRTTGGVGSMLGSNKDRDHDGIPDKYEGRSNVGTGLASDPNYSSTGTGISSRQTGVAGTTTTGHDSRVLAGDQGSDPVFGNKSSTTGSTLDEDTHKKGGISGFISKLKGDS